MARRYRWIIAAFVALVAIALLAPTAPSFGQSGEQAVYGYIGRQYTLAAGAALAAQRVANAVPAADVQQVARVLLPVIRKAAEATPLQFAAQANEETGELINPGTTFSNIADIYVASTITGGQSQEYKLVWTINGVVQPGLEIEGTIRSSPEIVFEHVCRREGSAFNCAGTPANFPPSTFVVQLFLDGALVQQAQAVVS